MRRQAAILTTFYALAVPVLALAWVGSYWASPWVGWRGEQKRVAVGVCRGAVFVSFWNGDDGWTFAMDHPGDVADSLDYWPSLRVPIWVLLIGCVGLGVLAFDRWRRASADTRRRGFDPLPAKP